MLSRPPNKSESALPLGIGHHDSTLIQPFGHPYPAPPAFEERGSRGQSPLAGPKGRSPFKGWDG
jgi:hypothetical protein